ncbi:MAG: hypothetical protein ACRC3B_18470 [Bacteroidia bacterium]
MKWYSMPVAVVAYSMLVVLGFAALFNYIGGSTLSSFWQIIGIIAASYLVLAFILSKLNLHWEITVLIQVALVLGPLLYFVNNNEPYQAPVFVFVVNPGYDGSLEITFKETAETQVKKRADTLFFPFDVEGKIQLQEDYRMVKAAMETNCYYMYTDRSRDRIPFVRSRTMLPADSAKKVLVAGESEVQGAKMKLLRYEVKKAAEVKF